MLPIGDAVSLAIRNAQRLEPHADQDLAQVTVATLADPRQRLRLAAGRVRAASAPAVPSRPRTRPFWKACSVPDRSYGSRLRPTARTPGSDAVPRHASVIA